MRCVFVLAVFLTGCSQESSEPSLAAGTFAGSGRDRLCIAGEAGSYRAGLIAFREGNINCSAAGRLEPAGTGWALVPKGEGECRIPLVIDGNIVRVGKPPTSCAYYCGPGASLEGKSYNRADMGAEAVDLAGDPLC